jgi:hypothetical protein
VLRVVTRVVFKELVTKIAQRSDGALEVVTWGAQSGDKGCVQRIGDMGCSKE